MLVKEDIEHEIGWNLDPQIVATFTSKPVLIAQTVNFKPGANRGAANNAAMNQNPGQSMANNNPGQMMTDNNNSQTMTNNSGQTTTGMNNGQSETGMSSGKPGTGNMITDTGIYASTPNKLSLVGKNAQFSNARVVRVVGPRTFTVASGNSEIYVMLDDASARGVGTQGKIDVGNTVNITGKFERLQMAEINDIKSNRFRDLTDEEREFLKKTPIYFQANQVSGSN